MRGTPTLPQQQPSVVDSLERLALEGIYKIVTCIAGVRFDFFFDCPGGHSAVQLINRMNQVGSRVFCFPLHIGEGPTFGSTGHFGMLRSVDIFSVSCQQLLRT